MRCTASFLPDLSDALCGRLFYPLAQMRCTAAFFLSARSDALYGCLSAGRELIACICDVLWRSLAMNGIYVEELVLKFNSRMIVRASVVNWNEVTPGGE